MGSGFLKAKLSATYGAQWMPSGNVQVLLRRLSFNQIIEAWKCLYGD